MTRAPLRRLCVAGVATVSLVATAGADTVPRDHGRPDAPVRLLAINDLHGNLEPPTGSGGRILDPDGPRIDVDGSLTGLIGGRYSLAGGAAHLAARLTRLRDANTMLVAAGDLIGASPLLSAAYHDEPTITLLDRLGLQVSAAGNHEFDQGITELRRIVHGGCHPVDGCSPAGGWRGARFAYLGANVLEEGTGGHALPPYLVKKINGVAIGFIGLVTRTTPSLVTASGSQGLRFVDEVEAANKVSRLLAKSGVKAQVALVHEGDPATPAQHPGSCPVIPAAGSRIAKALDPQIDLVISGHTHQAYVCRTTDPAGRDRVYTQASSFGRVITQIDFRVDRRTRDVVRSSVTAANHVVTRTAAPDPRIARFVETWRERVSAVADRPVGRITATIAHDPAGTGESPLGDLIADAQLAATAIGGGAEIALMNPGGVRADLTYGRTGSAGGDGVVTYGDAFAVQPFGNFMQVVTLTGAQLDALLEQQWTTASTRILLPSASLRYTVDLTKPVGERVRGIIVNGEPITPGRRIRVAANDFLVGGGDGFTVFSEGTDLWSGGPPDLDAFVGYLGARSPVAPPATPRITVVR